MARARSTPSHDSTDELIRLVDRWRTRKIVVVGDFMLDRYTYGNAERLSPDAPVPVLAIAREEDKPGGAANVCLDLLALRCQVACVGVVGDDGDGRTLRRALRDAGCDVSGLVASNDRPTTVKHSFIGLAQHRHPQKMFRVDSERNAAIAPRTAKRLLTKARLALRGAAVLCLEDYNKGVLTPTLCQGLVRLARRAGAPVLVDPPATADYRKFRGVTCMTPNRFEAALATGHSIKSLDDSRKWVSCARQLVRKLDMPAVVLTLDKHGALLLERGRQPVIVPTVARQVYDVTGAGDMVLAMLAAAVANGADWRAAVALANTAAGLEVEKFGVVPIPLDEVLLALLRKRHEDLGKVRTVEQLLQELAAHRSQGKKIVWTNGCFDILHAGHVSYLRQARRAGDVLVVGINSDRSIRRIKGPGRPVNRERDRILVLSELECVDYIVVFDADTPIDLIRRVKPDVLAKGADYRKSEVVGAGVVERHGGKVVLIDVVKGLSTTNIIGRIRESRT